ncbi:MAG: DUF1569 domain-containing protein [Crocinitomicaceae bacterium]|nr:DUF1569 domain-containing protein [Crocinitomicaceae bacterium]
MEFVQADLCAFLEILENLDKKKSASWGKMTPQRMIEHLSDCIYMSCGIGNHELLIPEEKIKGMQAFLISDKEMPQNIQVPFAKENTPLRNSDLELALDEFTMSWVDFEEMYSEDPKKTALHPYYGNLNYEQWLLLHAKHFTHHFTQFGLM